MNDTLMIVIMSINDMDYTHYIIPLNPISDGH